MHERSKRESRPRGREEAKFYADTMEGELPPEILKELRRMLEEG